MKYNKAEIINHVIAKTYLCCVKEFNDIILTDDNNLTTKPLIFKNNEVVIDLDCIEIIKAENQNKNRDRTMDCCFAISNESNLEIVLVELRFNYRESSYRKMANLKKKFLLKKLQIQNIS